LVRRDEVPRHGPEQVLVLEAGRESTDLIADERHDLRFVDRADERRAVSQALRDHVSVATEPIDDLGVGPRAVGGDPSRRGEVVQRHEWRHAVVADRVEHACVVIECGDAELTFFRFDPGPLDAEAVRVVSIGAEHREVLLEAVVVVDRVARYFDAR
jgi:hypothetical protein